MMDGTPKASRVGDNLPEDKRFGTDSWTFLAMLKPIRFDIDRPARINDAYSPSVAYPDAILGNRHHRRRTAQLLLLLSRRQWKDRSRQAAASSSRCERDTWSHVAVVCDRKNRRIETFINGFPVRWWQRLPKDFHGDYVLGGQLTVGCGWHNYWGLVDEVKVFRNALAQQVIDAELRDSSRFSASSNPEAVLRGEKATANGEVFYEVNACVGRARLRRSCGGYARRW